MGAADRVKKRSHWCFESHCSEMLHNSVLLTAKDVGQQTVWGWMFMAMVCYSKHDCHSGHRPSSWMSETL